MNATKFKAAAERLFARANPGAMAVAWTHGPRAVKWADGTRGFSGLFQAAGAGYRSREVVASYHDGGVWVR